MTIAKNGCTSLFIALIFRAQHLAEQ